MDVCRRENCHEAPVPDGLGFCLADLTAYLDDRKRFAALATELRRRMPAVFSLLNDREADRLAQFIVAHAANGARGFSNEFLLAGEVGAAFDALDEVREEQAHKREVVATNRRGTHRHPRLAGGLA